MSNLKSSLRSLLFLLVLACTFCNGQSQVPVRKEPRHHLVFESKEIRLLNVLIPPGDTTQFHIHNTPSLYIRLSNTTTGSQLLRGTASVGKSIAGTILFENLAAPNIRTHRVWNADRDTFHVMDIELLEKQAVFDQKPLAMSNLELVIDTNWVRAYQLSLLKGNDFRTKNKKQTLLLVSLNAGNLETIENGKSKYQTLRPGSFFVIKRKQSFAIKNTSDMSVQFILLELPPQ